jgi:hypothetical protein
MLRPLSTLGAALLLTLTTLSIGTSASADRPDQLPAQASAQAAQQALERAEALFAGGERGRGESAAHAHGREATLVLRDLATALPRLSGEDRQRAEAILARPTDGDSDPYGDGYTRESFSECSDDVCVHWVEQSADKIDVTSNDGDDIPDYAQQTLATMQQVHDTYAGAGYREPLPDGRRGGNKKTDIYLADVGSKGYYGYCASDQRRWRDGNAVFAYCVLDNDYAVDEFGSANTPTENLQVTAAHEYFHAVQFAYDYMEDPWFMEATATWAEDEVFDDIDDNVQYLRYGPMRRPRTALDRFGGLYHYGTWAFFRYLTERETAAAGGMPTLVRDMWRRADSTKRRDRYSMQAVKAVLGQRDRSLPGTFARFTTANRQPARHYDEAAANRYPAARLAGRKVLSPQRRKHGWEVRTDHLTGATFRVLPSRDMTNRRWKLRVGVDMAAKSRGSAAVATIHYQDKAPATRSVRLGRRGNGVVRVPFSRRSVKAVEVTLLNHSTRMRCWRDGSWRYSCAGVPRDDNLVQRLRVTAFR